MKGTDVEAIRAAIAECSMSGSPMTATRANEALERLTATPDGAWTLTAEDFAELEHWERVTDDRGALDDPDLIDRLRAVVDRPMVAAALARPGWRPRLVMIERLLTMGLRSTGYYESVTTPEGRKAAAVAGGLMTVADALDDVRAMLNGDPAKGAEPWQKRLAIVETKLLEMFPAPLPGFRFIPPQGYLDDVHRSVMEIVAELRALIES